MSRFNVRPIGGAGAPVAPPPPSDKKPSAYSAMKESGSASVASMVMPASGPIESKRTGRMTKDDARKHKMDLADARIQVLVTMKPTRAKIRDYIQSRIMELDDEKR